MDLIYWTNFIALSLQTLAATNKSWSVNDNGDISIGLLKSCRNFSNVECCTDHENNLNQFHKNALIAARVCCIVTVACLSIVSTLMFTEKDIERQRSHIRILLFISLISSIATIAIWMKYMMEVQVSDNTIRLNPGRAIFMMMLATLLVLYMIYYMYK